jgi:hypothetical protein
MKVIIAGSRSCLEHGHVHNAIEDSGFEMDITEVVSGTARGVDQMGERWAIANRIPIRRFPADWEKHGRSAGFRRNIQMADYADALIAVWDGQSHGTQHMIRIAQEAGLRVFVYRFVP